MLYTQKMFVTGQEIDVGFNSSIERLQLSLVF